MQITLILIPEIEFIYRSGFYYYVKVMPTMSPFSLGYSNGLG
jgi:hypothetical protein